MPASLARRYAVESEVLRRDDHPATFTWRGRRHHVRAVLDHWWETTAWWEDGETVGDDERERWRVEAAPAIGAQVVVELSFAWTTGTWTVDAVLD